MENNGEFLCEIAFWRDFFSPRGTFAIEYGMNRMARDMQGQRTYYRPGPQFPAGDSQDKAGDSQDKARDSQDKARDSQDKGMVDEQIRKICACVGGRLSPKAFEDIVVRLCGVKMMSAVELARAMGRSSDYIAQKLGKLVKEHKIQYRYLTMPNHPDQAYGVRGKTLSPDLPTNP